MSFVVRSIALSLSLSITMSAWARGSKRPPMIVNFDLQGEERDANASRASLSGDSDSRQVSQRASARQYFMAESRSPVPRNVLSEMDIQNWKQSFTQSVAAVTAKLAGSPTPFGADLSALSELNFQAAAIWSQILGSFNGDLAQAREFYLLRKKLAPSSREDAANKKQLSELKTSLEAYLQSSMLEAPGLYKTYALLPRSLPLHPLFVQLLVEQIATQKIYLINDGQETVKHNALWSKVSGKDFYASFKSYPSDWEMRNDRSLIDGQYVPVLTGPIALRNAFLLLGLNSASDNISAGPDCMNWGLFSASNHSILFHTSVFEVGYFTMGNFELPQQLRDGYRMNVGDLREVADEYVYKPIEKDCGRISTDTYLYQHSAEIVKKYRELWNDLR